MIKKGRAIQAVFLKEIDALLHVANENLDIVLNAFSLNIIGVFLIFPTTASSARHICLKTVYLILAV